MKHTLADPARFHQDGWTPEVRAAFLEALRVTGSVREAAQAVGKPASSAHNLRASAGSAAFRAEWARALGTGIESVRESAIERAINGQRVPVFWRGNEVGTKLVYNDRLLIALMRLYDAPAYHAERALAAQVVLAPQVALAPPPMTQDECIRRFNAVLEPFEREAAADAVETDEQALHGETSDGGGDGGADTKGSPADRSSDNWLSYSSPEMTPTTIWESRKSYRSPSMLLH